MAIFVIILLALIMVALIIVSFYTSVNSGAAKFGDWFEKLLDDKPDKKKE